MLTIEETVRYTATGLNVSLLCSFATQLLWQVGSDQLKHQSCNPTENVRAKIIKGGNVCCCALLYLCPPPPQQPPPPGTGMP